MIHASPIAPIPNAMKTPESMTSPTHVITIARVVEKHELTNPAIAMRARVRPRLDFRLGFESAIGSRVCAALTFWDDSKSTSTAAAATAVDRLTSCRSEIGGNMGATGEA